MSLVVQDDMSSDSRMVLIERMAESFCV